MKNKKVLGIFAIALVLVLGVSLVSAFGNGLGNNIYEEDKEALKTAIESNDYETWAQIKNAQVSEENFNEIKIRHQQRAEYRSQIQEARESEDYELLSELKAEFGRGKGMHRKNMNSGECHFAK